MKFKIGIIFIIVLTAYNVYGQSFSCTPESIILASNDGSNSTVEKTTVNWKRIDYHILDNTAIATTYKDINDPATGVNPTQRDELAIIEISPDKIVMMGGKMASPMWLTVDVIFPKDDNGYSFYVSDYPKTVMPGNPELVNLSKLQPIVSQNR